MFPLSSACFHTTFLIICGIEVNVLGPPHALELWLGVIKGMRHVEHFHSNSSSLVTVKCHGVITTGTMSR